MSYSDGTYKTIPFVGHFRACADKCQEELEKVSVELEKYKKDSDYSSDKKTQQSDENKEYDLTSFYETDEEEYKKEIVSIKNV